MSSPAGSRELPAVDERLVAPQTRYEIEDGKVVFVAPADEPHGNRHSKVSALVEAHVSEDYDVASDMLTRLTHIDDAAPDVSVYPVARDPVTGGRRIEELAFEIVSTERLVDAGRNAAKLVARGVRRVFAVDVERRRAFEWSLELAGWSILADGGFIEDRTLAVSLPVQALVRAAKSDDAVARALLAKQNPVLLEAIEQRAIEARSDGKVEGKLEGRLEGKLDSLLIILAARGLTSTAAEHARILESMGEIDRLLASAASCTSVRELLAS